MQALLKTCAAFLRNNRLVLLYSGILLTIYALWWLAFYPGVMTADSLDQWRQALSGSYNDAHPFTSTLFMNAFRWIRDTPAWVSLSQILLTSGIVASFIAYAQRRGLSWKICAATIAVFALWPVYGIYGVTIWKDILYSLFIVAVCLLTYLIIVDTSIARHRRTYIALALLCAAIPLWRHNGLPYLVAPFIALLIVKVRPRKTILLSGALAIGVYLIMHFGVGSLLHVKQAPILVEWLRMKTVAAVYNEKHPTITPADRKLFADLMPEQDWRTAYRCFHTDTTFMRFYQYHPISFTDQVSTNPKTEAAWKAAVIRTAAHNPTAIIKDHACVGKMLFSSQPSFIKYADTILSRADLPVVQPKPQLHTASIKTKLSSWLLWSSRSGVANFIFWSAIPAAAIAITLLIAALRRRAKATAALSILALLNPLGVIIIGSSSDYRYIYSLVLTGPLIVIAYCFERIVQRRSILHRSKH